MKLNKMLPPSRWIITHTNLETAIIMLTLLFLCQIRPALPHGNEYSLANSNLDEEIILDPSHDNEKSNESDAISANNDNKGGTHRSNDATHYQQAPSLVQMYDQYDPFAVTFEDYLKEASKSSSHHKDATIEDKATSVSAIPDAAGLIIEDEENLIKKKDTPIIDYIFPPTKNEKATVVEQEHQLDQSSNTLGQNTSELIKEIKLLFEWKEVRTNKCSKTCGKGFRLNHVFCVDLKYAVRVEDELCLKVNLAKPNGTSQEPCNEIDCQPKWTTVQIQECNSEGARDGVCQPNLYAKTQCVMVNRDGSSIHLEDFKCAKNPTEKELKIHSQAIEEDSIELNLDDQVESHQKNDILSNIDVENFNIDGFSRPSKNQPHNEPFFEAGPWSECSGAPCGQLGKRYRKLSCRLYLSRSSKFADLPDSSCHNSPKPDHQELCYIDCPMEEAIKDDSPSLNNSDTTNDGDDSLDEFVYDSEMTRYIWRKDGWTKCSAECLGGEHETLYDCWDKVAETTVSSELCDHESKPDRSTQRCNEIPCPPEWHVEPFSKCTRTCGSAGIKSRSIACMQQVPSKNGPSHLVVSNDLCLQTNGPMPNRMEPCNRIDCKPEWSVGPWSECSKKCGIGVRNRTVICVQEFSSREGSNPNLSGSRFANPDLIDAITISAKDWHPGKATQVPFHECYEEYRTIPTLDEKCFNFCENEPYIDADIYQNYRLTHDAMKRKSIALRIGGKAQVLEGKNLKIRCRIINRQIKDNLVKAVDQVEWRKDGVQIFVNGSTVAEKSYAQEDNSILGTDVLLEDNEQYMADQPDEKRVTRVTTKRSHSRSRNSLFRSWNTKGVYQAPQSGLTFTSQKGGRFSLVKENTLRIKRLRPDDSGLYTCSYGSLNESLELLVISRREFMGSMDKFYNNS